MVLAMQTSPKPTRLSPGDLVTLSRLLDEALVLTPEQALAWLSALPPDQQHLVPALRDMLREHHREGPDAFLATGPSLLPVPGETRQVGELIGAYRLIREIGHGGMSVVWLAERHDGAVKREVALKMPVQSLGSPAQVERFLRERDLVAMLSHPRIARLYDAGVAQSGRPYIVLEYVQGQPITQACNQGRMDVAARLRVFLQALAAVEHAHQHLVVHRDIKPSNVYVDHEGRVKLLDFGIAKLLSEASGADQATQLTHEGSAGLTPRYASPEQIEGQPVSTATDIYSLGVLLYELLVGTVPHAHAQGSVASTVRALLQTDALPPSQAALDNDVAAARGLPSAMALRQRLAGDLDTIVLKALRRSPADRYSSVERFADDIARYLSHRPILARPATLWHRGRLFVQRHRQATAAVVAAGVALLALAGTAWQQHLQTVAAQVRANAVRDFMFDLMASAETSANQPDREPSSREMMLAALQRARAGFGEQPRLKGEILLDLGHMLGRLGADDESAQALRESLGLLSGHAPADDPALNNARARLADLALAEGQSDAARGEALTVVGRCQEGAGCARARALARVVLCNLELQAGHPDEAYAHMRLSVHDSAKGFANQSAEVAMAWKNLAVVARRGGRLSDARQALDQATALSKAAPLTWADQLSFAQTQAMLDHDLGRYADAREHLQRQLAQTTQPTQRVPLLRMLATTEWALGHVAETLAATQAALALVPPDKPNLDALLARQARARALAMSGAAEQAWAEARAVVQGLRDLGYADAALEVLRARRVMGEVQARAGAWPDALALLQQVARQQALAQGAQALELAQTLDLIGCLQRELRAPEAARDAHRQAAALMADRLPPDHPLRLRNQLYQDLLADRLQATAPTQQALAQSAARLQQSLPPTSVWRTVIHQSLQRVPCPATQAWTCVAVL